IVVGHLAEVERNIVAAPAVVHFAVIARKMPAEPAKMPARGISFNHGPRPHRQTRTDLDVFELIPPRCECVVKGIGLAEGGSVIEPHPRPDQARGLTGGNSSRRGAGFPRGHFRPLYYPWSSPETQNCPSIACAQIH